MSEIASSIKTYPQKLVNVRVKEKPPIEKLEKVQEALKKAENLLSGKGRVLVRYSGTEPLLRIMVEAENEELINEIIDMLQEAAARDGITES